MSATGLDVFDTTLHKTNSWLSGEFRYTYRDSQLQLSSGGTEARFNGVAHAIHYDLVMHPRPKHGTKALPFLAVGGGMKLYQGTGHEVAYQPLDNIALLSRRATSFAETAMTASEFCTLCWPNIGKRNPARVRLV